MVDWIIDDIGSIIIMLGVLFIVGSIVSKDLILPFFLKILINSFHNLISISPASRLSTTIECPESLFPVNSNIWFNIFSLIFCSYNSRHFSSPYFLIVYGLCHLLFTAPGTKKDIFLPWNQCSGTLSHGVPRCSRSIRFFLWKLIKTGQLIF